MKITPRKWLWDRAKPSPTWLGEGSTEYPVVWQAWLPGDSAIQSHLFSILSAEERARITRFHNEEDQQRFLTGRGLLRILAGTHLGMMPQRVEFGYGAYGKPYLVSTGHMRGLHFNVSHSGKIVLLAFSFCHEVGVDVEEIRQTADLAETTRQFFMPEAYQSWLQLSSSEQLNEFYQAWTRHEAELKARGIGFIGEPRNAAVVTLECFDLELPDGYQGAAAGLPAVTGEDDLFFTLFFRRREYSRATHRKQAFLKRR